MQTNELNERKFRSLPRRETTSISGEIVSTGTCVPFGAWCGTGACFVPAYSGVCRRIRLLRVIMPLLDAISSAFCCSVEHLYVRKYGILGIHFH